MIKFDLSELPIAPKQYQSAGVILLAAGVLLLILGLLFAFMTASRREADSNRIKISAEDCTKRIDALGLHAHLEGELLKIQDGNLVRGMELLASSSQAAALCANWTLHEYCLGEACTPPGLTMSLKYMDKK